MYIVIIYHIELLSIADAGNLGPWWWADSEFSVDKRPPGEITIQSNDYILGLLLARIIQPGFDFDRSWAEAITTLRVQWTQQGPRRREQLTNSLPGKDLPFSLWSDGRRAEL